MKKINVLILVDKDMEKRLHGVYTCVCVYDPISDTRDPELNNLATSNSVKLDRCSVPNQLGRSLCVQ